MKVSELICPSCGELPDECECEKRPVKGTRKTNKKMKKEKDG